MKPLKYYVGINVKSDRRQVFGAHATPTTRTHGKHFQAVIGPFKSLRAALYTRDHGANNPQIRCPADAERLCQVKRAPTFQRKIRKLRRNPTTVVKVVSVRTTRTDPKATKPKRRTGVPPVIRRKTKRKLRPRKCK